jgi:hypothetical protein
MGHYGDENLIKYEETIQLHFDTRLMMAWLTLKNYTLVFHRRSWGASKDTWNDVMKITIGIPAGELSPKECQAFAQDSGLDEGIVRILKRSDKIISISAMLDAVAIIKFQVQILSIVDSYSLAGVDGAYRISAGDLDLPAARKSIQAKDLCDKVEKVLKDLGARGMLSFPLRNWLVLGVANLTHGLKCLLSDPPQPVGAPSKPARGPGALWIAPEIESNQANTTHFTAYFPHPRFIIEEQKTESRGIKTSNQDMRLIKPIPSPSNIPIENQPRRPFIYTEFLDELDRDRFHDVDKFLARSDHARYLTPDNFPAAAKYLHGQLTRIDCYGFRGDDRDAAAVMKATGFLPGVTRTYKDELRETGDMIDFALKKATVTNDGGKAYREVMKNLSILTLCVYTLDQNCKGYISTTTSIAIAKYFSNYWAKDPDQYKSTYCYAVRCKGAFHLPTDVEQTPARFKKEEHAKNVFTHFAEQEVANPGSIWWEDVVGVRKIRIDDDGQYFSGPVFLSDALRGELLANLKPVYVNQQLAVWKPTPDNGAFDELFELLSGRNQGAGYKIYLSYKDPPFDCPQRLIDERKKLAYPPIRDVAAP